MILFSTSGSNPRSHAVLFDILTVPAPSSGIGNGIHVVALWVIGFVLYFMVHHREGYDKLWKKIDHSFIMLLCKALQNV